jgi:hypothetical protein
MHITFIDKSRYGISCGFAADHYSLCFWQIFAPALFVHLIEYMGVCLFYLILGGKPGRTVLAVTDRFGLDSV